MSETTFERGKTITYPNIYPRLSFTPIFGHNGDFVWVEEVKATWAEQDDEFAFVRSTVHDQRVDRLKEENAKLREYVNHYMESIANGGCEFCPYEEDLCDVETYPMYDGCALYEEMRELGIVVDDESV